MDNYDLCMLFTFYDFIYHFVCFINEFVYDKMQRIDEIVKFKERDLSVRFDQA